MNEEEVMDLTDPQKNVEKQLQEQLAEKKREVGLCYHCKKMILGGEKYTREKAVYKPGEFTLEHGLFHSKCLLPHYRELAIVFMTEINSLNNSYLQLIEMTRGQKKDDDGELLGGYE